MTRILVGMVGVLGLAGCAGLPSADVPAAEHALAAAGFQARLADTPEKQAQLRALTPRTVLWGPQDSELRYLYAEPTGCRCLYVGGEENYQRLRRQEPVGADRFFAVYAWSNTIDWELWEISPDPFTCVEGVH
jgi:hypothetical protein